jgi:hypothetical protein
MNPEIEQLLEGMFINLSGKRKFQCYSAITRYKLMDSLKITEDTRVA